MESLKKLLKLSIVKNMYSFQEVELSGNLTLRGGELYYWYEESHWYWDRCVLPSDCSGGHQSCWLTEKRWACVEPSIGIVQRFGVTAEKIKQALHKLKKR